MPGTGREAHEPGPDPERRLGGHAGGARIADLTADHEHVAEMALVGRTAPRPQPRGPARQIEPLGRGIDGAIHRRRDTQIVMVQPTAVIGPGTGQQPLLHANEGDGGLGDHRATQDGPGVGIEPRG